VKKTLLLALIAVFALTGMAFAENRVEVKVTSEPIQYHATCDKAGGFTLEFDSDTTLAAGDQITIDVDFGVTLCRLIDLEISPNGSGTRWVTGNIPATSSPVIDAGAGATSTGAGVYFRLFGLPGSQRITLSVLGEVGVDSLVVGPGVDDTLTIGFLGQKTNADFTQDGIWIEGAVDDTYDVAATVADNTLCINVSQYDFNTVNANMDSAGDKFTFIPSNPQVAHVVGAVSYTLIDCEKVATGNIELGSTAGQGGNDSCVDFDWDTGEGYCPGTHSSTNLFVVETTSAGTFYSVGEYQLEMTILTDGVYWTDDSPVGESFITGENACADGYPNVTVFTVAEYYDADGNAGAAPVPASSSDCDFTEDAVSLITDCSDTLITTGNRRAVAFDIPAMKYRLNEVMAGDEVIIEIKLIKCPCGSVWTQQLNVGTFGCAAPEGPTFSLLYPYGTAMSGDVWWDGFVLTNISSDAGTATLYFWEADNDQGQMIVSVPAGGMFVSTFSAMLNAPVGGQVVQAMTQIGGSGVIGDSQLYVIACTDFNVDGFIFMGNGVATARGEAMGYLPRDNKSGLCSD
jgi:hypothetical protein